MPASRSRHSSEQCASIAIRPSGLASWSPRCTSHAAATSRQLTRGGMAEWSIRDARMVRSLPYAARVTLPDPYRGYAQPTWDTKTLAALIAVLGGVGNPPVTGGGGGGATAFADVELPGNTSAQTLAFATATKISLNSEISDTGNNFNPSSNVYTCPNSGLYFCHAVIRINDAQPSAAGGPNFGMGIHTTEDLAETSFLWHKLPNIAAGSGRAAVEYTRLASFGAGSQLRLYAFWDSGSGSGSCGLYSARMQICKIG